LSDFVSVLCISSRPALRADGAARRRLIPAGNPPAGENEAPYFFAGQYFWKNFISGGGWSFWIGMT
jgi:hypothetical protein